MFADRFVVAQHALQVLDIDLLCSVPRTCHSAAKRIQDHLHGSLLVLCYFIPGLYILSELYSHPISSYIVVCVYAIRSNSVITIEE